jgi:hypothetical protein
MGHDQTDCGHTEQEHREMHDLLHLTEHVTMLPNPRVAFILTEDGEIHFASSIPPGEAAKAMEQMAAKLRRYPANYATDHFDRARAAGMN